MDERFLFDIKNIFPRNISYLQDYGRVQGWCPVERVPVAAQKIPDSLTVEPVCQDRTRSSLSSEERVLVRSKLLYNK